MAEVMPIDMMETTTSNPERMAVNYGSVEASEVSATETTPNEPEIPRPGDPEPINPTPTEPPDGSGDPPLDDPTSPGGPGEPA